MGFAQMVLLSLTSVLVNKSLHHLARRLSSKESDGANRRNSAASLLSGLALLEVFTRYGKLGFVALN
jgi:hypothetical protein